MKQLVMNYWHFYTGHISLETCFILPYDGPVVHGWTCCDKAFRMSDYFCAKC